MRHTLAFSLTKAFSLLALLALLPSACKTANSQAQSLHVDNIETMSLAEWTASCQAQLADPQGGASAKSDLQALAHTNDCQEAYPVVRQVVDQALHPAAD